MPRKKTTPTIIDPRTTYDITPARLVSGVATTEPDTTLNPDRAQVAAVADLPRESEPAPVTSVFRVEQMPEGEVYAVHLTALEAEALAIALYDVAEGCSFPEAMQESHDLVPYAERGYAKLKGVPAQAPTSAPATPEAMDGLRATIAEQSARIATLEKMDHATRTYFSVRLDAAQQEVEDAMVREYARVIALGAASDEKDARIAELTAERDAIQHHHDEWMKFRGDADWELANLRRDGREEDRKRIAELEAELVATRTAPASPPTPARPVATWTGDVLLTPGGKVLGRVNVSRGTFGHLQAAPIYYPADDQERLGPIGTIETAREWVSDYARKIGWVVQ